MIIVAWNFRTSLVFSTRIRPWHQKRKWLGGDFRAGAKVDRWIVLSILQNSLLNLPLFFTKRQFFVLVYEWANCNFQPFNTVVVLKFISFHFLRASPAFTLNLCALFIKVPAEQNEVVVQLPTFTLKGRRVADFKVGLCLFVFIGLFAGFACESGFIQHIFLNPTEFYALEWLSAVRTVFFRFNLESMHPVHLRLSHSPHCYGSFTTFKQI